MFGGPSLKLFRLAGFPVAAHWSLLLAVALMAWSYGGLGGVWLSVLIFGSVLLHELGHSVVARRLRVPIDGIDLHLFGGVAKMREPPRSPGDEMWIAIAGPVVSLALGLGFSLASFGLGPAAPGWLPWIAGTNLMLGLFNLVPALPMDGGRVLRALLARRRGLAAGTRLAVKINRVVAAGLFALGLFGNAWLIALAVLVWMMGSAELAQIRRHEVLWQRGYGDLWDPWARYQRAVEREQADSSRRERSAARVHGEPLTPEVLAPEHEAGPRPPSQRLVRDAFGRWVIVTGPMPRG